MRKTKVEIAYSMNLQYFGLNIIIILLHTHLINKVDTETCNHFPKTMKHQTQFLAWNRRGHILRKNKKTY